MQEKQALLAYPRGLKCLLGHYCELGSPCNHMQMLDCRSHHFIPKQINTEKKEIYFFFSINSKYFLEHSFFLSILLLFLLFLGESLRRFFVVCPDMEQTEARMKECSFSHGRCQLHKAEILFISRQCCFKEIGS